MRFILVGSKASARLEGFGRALVDRGFSTPAFVDYGELLTGEVRVEQCVPSNSIVRLDSPGSCPLLERAFLLRGASLCHLCEPRARRLSTEDLLSRRAEKGRILAPAQWFGGFRDLLLTLDSLAGVRFLSQPRDILTTFDKRVCHRLCVEAGVPVPRSLGMVASFEELLSKIESARMPRVFVKLATGSSASGVVALMRNREQLRAFTTVELVRSGGEVRFYNNRRVRTYCDSSDIGAVIEFLCGEGVHVEEWLPKARWDCVPFDLRVVVIGGRACPVVMRLSDAPMTNLHLLSERHETDEIRVKLGEEKWAEIMSVCERAAALVPGCFQVGVDVVLTPDYRPFVLELNAFGDFLKDVRFEGETVYEREARILSETYVSTTGS